MTDHPPPLTDDDTYAVIDEALTALAGRRHAWLGEDTTMIHLLASLIAQADRFLPQLVTDARAEGLTWTDLATLLGTNPDEARLRFDPDSPIADGRWPYQT
jgi:hypothetical protein